MTLVVDLTRSEEEQLSAAARQAGLTPAEVVRRLLQTHLSEVAPGGAEDLDARLRRSQEQGGTQLLPAVPTAVLFAEWAEEDAMMTPEEREAEDDLWQDLERALTEDGHVVRLRQPGRW